jgi:hypothetical protein
LSSLISDFFNIFEDISKIKIINIFKEKVFINGEIFLYFLFDLIPMSWSHALISKICNHWQEDEPFLDLFIDTLVCISLLLYFHLLKSLEKLLNFIFHHEWFSSNPLIEEEFLKDLCASIDVIPKNFHVINGNLDSLDIFNSFLNKIAISELLSIIAIIIDLILEDFEFIKDSIKLLESDLCSTFVLEEFSSLHFLSELSDIIFQLLDVGFVFFVFHLNHWSNLLLGVLADLLDICPLLVNLL